jgi:hypothetical protein
MDGSCSRCLLLYVGFVQRPTTTCAIDAWDEGILILVYIARLFLESERLSLSISLVESGLPSRYDVHPHTPTQ